jgi:hypothetical protein
MELFFYIFSQFAYCWCIERLLVFFCKLVLYPVTLLKVFMMCGSFLMEFFESFRYKIMSSAKRDSLSFSFSICILFFLLCSS